MSSTPPTNNTDKTRNPIKWMQHHKRARDVYNAEQKRRHKECEEWAEQARKWTEQRLTEMRAAETDAESGRSPRGNEQGESAGPPPTYEEATRMAAVERPAEEGAEMRRQTSGD